MNDFEERHNDDKEEWLQFGSNEAEKFGCLAAGSEPKKTLRTGKKSEWSQAQVRSSLKGSQLSKKHQAKIVEACVESGFSFEVGPSARSSHYNPLWIAATDTFGVIREPSLFVRCNVST